MEEVLIRLLKKERISSILKTVECHYKDLHCIDIFYIKDGQYYIARSFYTDSWVAMRPVGPDTAQDGNIIMETIEDVATILTFNSAISWKSQASPTVELLKEIYNLIVEQSKQFITDLFAEHATLIHQINFTFTPVPQMIVTLMQNDRFLGAVTVDMLGHVQLLNHTDYFVEILVDEINRNCVKSVYKELRQCLPEAYK